MQSTVMTALVSLAATMMMANSAALAQKHGASSAALDAKIASGNYTSEELANIDTALRMISAKRPPSPAEMAEFFTKNYKLTRAGMDTFHSMTGQGPLSEGSYTETSMNDRKDEVLDLIAKGNRVWVYFIVRGHHTGTFFRQPATGKPISVHETAFLTFNNDHKIDEAHFELEELELARQIGVPIGLTREPAAPTGH